MSVALDNFYAAMPLIVERLRDQLPYRKSGGIRTVDAADLLAGHRNVAELCPAVFVLPVLANESDTSDTGGVVVDTQEYQVTIVVANIHDPDKVAAIDLAAGKWMFMAFGALAGHRLGDGFHGGIQYKGRGAPYYEAGYAEYPLFFAVTAALSAQ